jgi:hypothetical protein
MEKKEIQKWRDRLIKMFGIYHSDGQEYVTCPLCGINLDELAKHMIEELDKAREEGRREGSEITSRYISDFVKSESGKSGRKEILEYIEELSKLKQ